MGGGEHREKRSLEPVEVPGLFMKKPEAAVDGAGSETGQGCDELGARRGSGPRPIRVDDMTDLCSDSEEPLVVPPAKRSRTMGKDEGMNDIEGFRNNNGGRAEVKEEMEEVVVADEEGQGALAALAARPPPGQGQGHTSLRRCSQIQTRRYKRSVRSLISLNLPRQIRSVCGPQLHVNM